MRRAFDSIGRVLLALLLGASFAQARELSFEQRVAAQRAIEQVYYRHQIGVTKTFEDAVPQAVLEAKVQKYLQQTLALEVYWTTRVTDTMLGQELQRMTRGSRLPDRLQELFAALHNDPFLIKECLARATLVDRLTRNFYAFDTSLHAEARQRVEELHAQLATGALDPAVDHPDRSVVDLVVRGPEAPGGSRDGNGLARRSLSPDEFEKERARLPDAPGRIAPVEEEREAFVIRIVLSDAPSEVRVASYVVPKQSWDLWWETAKGKLHPEQATAVASDKGALSIAGSSFPCSADDTWGALDNSRGASERGDHTAVWTGTELIVWGGNRGNSLYDFLDTGDRYNPATDTWTATSTIGAPDRRIQHAAVWTGSSMVIWGGYYVVELPVGFRFVYLNSGGRYDPVTDTWTATSIDGAPSARAGHTAIWTGRVMVAWGGSGSDYEPLNTGGRYDPATDTWAATSTEGVPSGRFSHTTIWTGTEMVVWGGFDNVNLLDTGGRYDPASDSWLPTSLDGAPSGRVGHTAVWTGSRMVVWGGYGDDYLNTGGRYDPATDTWAPTSTDGAPSRRLGHTAVWTGSVMLVSGGFADLDLFNTGGLYDPAADTWKATSTVGAPSARFGHSAVWTGSVVVVWGGYSDDAEGASHSIKTGGRYDPATDTWTATSTVGVPIGRTGHTAVWTGSLMVVWGGYNSTGGRYDPATDTWTGTSIVGAPRARSGHTAVWTGSTMVVWGGGFNTGGRYDPVSDVWTATSIVGAPSARSANSAVWTGSVMVVWGGYFYEGYSVRYVDTGGRYDPVTDSWTPTPTEGAPYGRGGHTAVWTGSSMVVWGGQSYDDDLRLVTYLNTGGRYDPVADSWTTMSTEGAPSGRSSHTAVWTGSEMVAWGGSFYDYEAELLHYVGTGGRYDPVADLWTPTTTDGSPSGRIGHTAIWTGSVMVVWGGLDGNRLNTGGRYDPTADTWNPTSINGAPSARAGHTAVWTGESMVVWGGDIPSSNTGGSYILVMSPDSDGDGYTVCDGDCNDAAPGIHPGVAEACNGIDDNCDGVADDAGDESCDDHDACTADICQGEAGCSNAVLDHDADGICDLNDSCPATISTRTLVIDTCDTGVSNHLFPSGCNFGDRIAACRAGAKNHGQFASCVAHLADVWKRVGLIGGRESGRIVSCVARQRR